MTFLNRPWFVPNAVLPPLHEKNGMDGDYLSTSPKQQSVASPGFIFPSNTDPTDYLFLLKPSASLPTASSLFLSLVLVL